MHPLHLLVELKQNPWRQGPNNRWTLYPKLPDLFLLYLKRGQFITLVWTFKFRTYKKIIMYTNRFGQVPDIAAIDWLLLCCLWPIAGCTYINNLNTTADMKNIYRIVAGNRMAELGIFVHFNLSHGLKPCLGQGLSWSSWRWVGFFTLQLQLRNYLTHLGGHSSASCVWILAWIWIRVWILIVALV